MRFKNILFTGTTAAVMAVCIGPAFAAEPMKLTTKGYVDAKIKPVDERSQANTNLLGNSVMGTEAPTVTGAVEELRTTKLDDFARDASAIVVTGADGALTTSATLKMEQVNQLPETLDTKQDKLTSANEGVGIKITTGENGQTIISSSATGESVTYSAGEYITITDVDVTNEDGTVTKTKAISVLTANDISADSNEVATASAVYNYALPIPPADCGENGESACVLGVDGAGAPYWMKLEMSLSDRNASSGDEGTGEDEPVEA